MRRYSAKRSSAFFGAGVSGRDLLVRRRAYHALRVLRRLVRHAADAVAMHHAHGTARPLFCWLPRSAHPLDHPQVLSFLHTLLWHHLGRFRVIKLEHGAAVVVVNECGPIALALGHDYSHARCRKKKQTSDLHAVVAAPPKRFI